MVRQACLPKPLQRKRQGINKEPLRELRQAQGGRYPLAKIRRGQLMLVIDAAREANKMRTANLLLGELGQMFRHAAAREWIQGDPTAAITRKDAGGQDKATECLMTPKSSCFVTSLRSPRIEITILRRPEASAARAHGTGGVVDSCNAGARRRSSDHQTQRRRESQVSYLDDPCGRVEEQEAARCPSERIRIGSVGSHVRNSGRWGICV